MHITTSTENYMEAILLLQQKKGDVHAVDVAHHLGFSKPTISQYMKQYVRQGLVQIDDNGHIRLSESGLAIAERTLERHRIISALFMALGVPEDVALEDACKVEHDLSEITFECIKKYYRDHIPAE